MLQFFTRAIVNVMSKGHVFSFVYHFVQGLNLPYPRPPVQGPPSRDMFKLVQLGPHCTGTPPLFFPPTDLFKLVHQTVGKRAIVIPLQNFLVRHIAN